MKEQSTDGQEQKPKGYSYGPTLVVKPSEMEVGHEYHMRLGTIFLVAVKTVNDNVMFWEINR